MRFILLFFLLISATHVYGADEEETQLTAWQTTLLQRHIEDYFDPRKPADLSALKTLRPWLPTIDLLLRELHTKQVSFSSAAVRKRVLPLMTVIHNLAAQAPAPRSIGLLTSLHESLFRLLRNTPAPSEMRHLILELYDRWHLWGIRDLWYILNLRELRDIVDNSHRLRAVLQHANPEESGEIANMLRAARPHDLATYALLMDTGHMEERELVAFLRMASVQFATSLARTPNDESRDFRLGDIRSRLVAGKLNVIMGRLVGGDMVVGSAFIKAAKVAERAQPLGYDRMDRLFFFTLLQEGRLDWYDRVSWRLRVDEVAYQNIRLRDRYRVQDNVIVVNFTPADRCEDDLE
ncbi:MAG: hypothetical protein KF799_01285 [Bdellovibrionales bacterium]|nr:hypothetical protein [Bdellovibrionales bacterium]